MNYKELQQWGREKKRTVKVHSNAQRKPGNVLRFSDRAYVVATSGALVRVQPEAR